MLSLAVHGWCGSPLKSGDLVKHFWKDARGVRSHRTWAELALPPAAEELGHSTEASRISHLENRLLDSALTPGLRPEQRFCPVRWVWKPTAQLTRGSSGTQHPGCSEDSYLRLSTYRSDASLHLLGTFYFLRCGMKEK